MATGFSMFDGNCQIRRANIRFDGRAQVDLKAENGAFDWTWFFSSVDHAPQVLAVALTAIATRRGVYVTLDEPVKPESEVGNFGILG